MKTTKGKIIAKIAIALVIIGLCALIVLDILPLDTSEEKLNLIVGATSAISIFTLFSVFATIQEDKHLKKT